MVVEGKATLEFEDGSKRELSTGDYINIPAHVKHKVVQTDPNQITIWLAIFINLKKSYNRLLIRLLSGSSS